MNTTNKIPITFDKFNHYINVLRNECDFREALYQVGVYDIISRVYSFDICVELLETLFNDKNNIISEWIFEENFGEVNNISVEQLYDMLIQKE